jgi:hypothetical protein
VETLGTGGRDGQLRFVNVLRGQLPTNRHGLQHPVASLDPTSSTIYPPQRLLQDYVGQAVAATVMAAARSHPSPAFVSVCFYSRFTIRLGRSLALPTLRSLFVFIRVYSRLAANCRTVSLCQHPRPDI